MTWAWCGNRGMAMAIAIAVVAFGSVASSGIAGEESGGGWRYVIPEPGEPHAFAFPRAVALRRDKPAGFKDATTYRGHEQRYAEIVFGTINSAPVAIAVDQVSPVEADVYVDGDRSRSFSLAERHAVRLPCEGSGGPLYVPLNADSVANNVAVPTRRTIVLWPARGGRSLRIATAGCLASRAEIDDREVAARRVDADGDGFFDGPTDLLWMDLNGDGNWDPFSEMFANAPVLRLAGKRVALRTAPDGRPAVAPLEDFGKLECTLGGLAPKSRVQELSVSLVGRDGIPVTFTSNGQQADVPVGEYRVYMVTLVLTDPDGGAPWFYHFRPPTWQTETRWHAVAAGKLTRFEPLDKLSLDGVLQKPPVERTKPNQELSVQPRLSTGDGLIMVFCCRSSSWDNKTATEAQVQIVASSGNPVAGTKAGFS